MAVDIPECTVQQNFPVDELSGSDTVVITITMEWLVSLAQPVACLVDEALAALPVKAELRCVTLKSSSVAMENRDNNNRKRRGTLISALVKID